MDFLAEIIQDLDKRAALAKHLQNEAQRREEEQYQALRRQVNLEKEAGESCCGN